MRAILVAAMICVPTLVSAHEGRTTDVCHSHLLNGYRHFHDSLQGGRQITGPSNDRESFEAIKMALENGPIFGKVSSTTLNIRETPNGRIVGALNQGDVVKMFEFRDGWVRSAAREGEFLGWVFRKHIEGSFDKCFRWNGVEPPMSSKSSEDE